jgi:tetratricopeptide (TPR) repeat protein
VSIWHKLRESVPVQAACLALVMLLFLALAQPNRAKVAVARGSRLLVADFVNDTGNPHLGPELKGILDLTLEQSSHLVLIPEPEVQDSLRRLGRDPSSPITPDIAGQICIRERAPAFLQPCLSRLGSSFVMSAQLVSVKDGLVREAGVDMVRANDEGDLLLALDELGRRVREMLGESRDSLAITSGLLPAYYTASTEALQLFAKALALYRKVDYEGQLAMLEQAVALDPHFAMAHMRLASYYAQLGQTEKTFKHVSLARETAGNLPPYEKYRILGTYCRMRQRFPEAMQQWLSLAAIYPESWEVHFEIAQTELTMGNAAKAVDEFQAAARLNEWQTDTFLGLCIAQLLDGKTDAARKAWERAAALEPENLQVIYTGGLIDLVENNLGSSLRAFQKVKSNPSAAIRSYGAYLLAQAQIYGGHYQLAVETLRAGIEENMRQGDLLSANDKWLALGQIHLLLDDQASALADCGMVSLPKGDAVRMACLGTIYARLGHVGEARELLKQIQLIPSTLLVRFQTEILRGEVDLAEGRAFDAVRSLAKAKELDAACTPLEPLARALARADRWDQAAKEYIEACERKATMLFPLNRPWFTGTWVRALLDAGLCMDKLGRRPEAQQYYRNYLWVLDGADPSLSTIQEAKALLRTR